MKFPVSVGLIDDGGQVYYIVHNDDDLEALYEHDRDWWRNRTHPTPEFAQNIEKENLTDAVLRPSKN